jgi:hypothetical protein
MHKHSNYSATIVQPVGEALDVDKVELMNSGQLVLSGSRDEDKTDEVLLQECDSVEFCSLTDKLLTDRSESSDSNPVTLVQVEISSLSSCWMVVGRDRGGKNRAAF